MRISNLKNIGLGMFLILGLTACKRSESIDVDWREIPVISDIETKPEQYQRIYDQLHQGIRQSKQSYESLRSLALFYQANELFNEAQSIFEKLVVSNSVDPKVLYYYSKILSDYGEVDHAIRCLDQCILLQSEHTLSYLRKADLLFKKGELELASVPYEKCLALEPDFPYALLGLARIHIHHEHWEDAEKTLNRLIGKDPTLATSYRLLIPVYEALGKDALARKANDYSDHYGRHREVSDPWLDELVYLCYEPYRLQVLSDIYDSMDQAELAVVLLKRAYEIDSSDTSTANELVKLYFKLQQPDKGLIILDEMIKKSPSFVSGHCLKISELTRQKRFQDAKEAVEHALSSNPDSSKIRYNAGILYDELNMLEYAELNFWKAVEVDPMDSVYQLGLGNLLWKRGNTKQAIRVFNKVCELSADVLEPRVILATHYLNQKRFNLAIKRICEIEAINPHFEELHFLKVNYACKMGNESLRKGDTASARNYYNEALVLQPGYLEAINNLLFLFVKEKDLEGICRILDPVFEMETIDSRLIVSAAKAYYSLGDIDIALKWIHKGLSVPLDANLKRELEILKQKIGR